MNIDQYGRVQVSEQEAFSALYSEKVKSLDGVFLDNLDSIEMFNSAVIKNADSISLLKVLDNPEASVEEFDKLNQQQWFIPEGYGVNVFDWLYEQCDTEIKRQRVNQELELFVQYNMIDVLCFLKYLVDTMRKHNIVWGVGRGSCVASYCLFLIGIHKIDSLKYSLDIKEFLR